MTRPKITLHIFTSMDGKITGSFANAPECKPAAELFKAIGFQENHPASFHFQGWLYGSNTGEEFTNHAKSELKEVTAEVPEGDHIINLGKEKYFIAFDRTGKLGWQGNTTSYADVEAHVLEILTGTSNGSVQSFSD